MQLRNKYYPYPVIVEGGDYYEIVNSHLLLTKKWWDMMLR